MIFVCMPLAIYIVSILLRQHQIISVVQAIQILVLPSVGLTLSLVCHYILGTDNIWLVLPSHNIFLLQDVFFADFSIAVVFYLVIKTSWIFFCILFGFCHTQILNLRAKINFANMLKIIRKSGKFGHICKIDFCSQI